MNFPIRISALAGAAFAVAVCSAGSPVSTSDRKALEDQYRRFNAAYVHRDFKTIGAFFTPTCVVHLSSGMSKMKSGQFVMAMQGFYKAIDVLSASTKIVKIDHKAGSDDYVVTSSSNCRYRFQPPAPYGSAKKPPATVLNNTQAVVDTWRHDQNGWLIIDRLVITRG